MTPRMVTWQEDDPRKSAENMFDNWHAARDKAEEASGSIERAYMLNTRIEQAPNPNSRITIGPDKDALGVPRANLHWELTPLDKRSIRTMYHLLGKELGRTGLGAAAERIPLG